MSGRWVTLPGAEIGFALGFRDGVLSIVIGGIILSVIAVATATVGASNTAQARAGQISGGMRA